MPAPPELIHTGTMSVHLSANSYFIPGGPLGTRVVAEVDSVTIEGNRLNATMVGHAAADWLTVSPDRSFGDLDVRITLQTDDDVLIYCTYGGRIDLARGRAVATPLFQTGDERYDWLVRAQFLLDGTRDADTNVLTYEMYEVRLA